MIPSYMLKQVYVKGSLKNVEGGFEFALRNNIDSGTLIGLGPVTVDGTAYAPATITLKTPRGEYHGDQVNSHTPVYFGIGMQATLSVAGKPLPAGTHHLVLALLTAEAGSLEIDVTDTI
mgnify:FL=1